MNIHDGVQAIVFAGKQDLSLNPIDEAFSFFQLGTELVEYRLTLARKLHERLRVLQALPDLTVYFEAFLEAGALLKDFTGAVLIGPEGGIGDLLLQFVQLPLLGAGVKETSARPRCESSVG
jgi:hypothetical protein